MNDTFVEVTLLRPNGELIPIRFGTVSEYAFGLRCQYPLGDGSKREWHRKGITEVVYPWPHVYCYATRSKKLLVAQEDAA